MAFNPPQQVHHHDQMPMPRKLGVIFVLGQPGAGKGTQCARVVEHFGCAYISTGDLLRKEQASGSAAGKIITQNTKEGKLVPTDITLRLVLQALTECQLKTVLIDGFPRNLDNLEEWQKVAGEKVETLGCLNFDCPDDNILTVRLLRRGVTSRRVDDNAEAIHARLQGFRKATLPVIEHFRTRGLLHTIKSINTIEEVWAETKAFFENHGFE